jgi:hypothetical protein
MKTNNEIWLKTPQSQNIRDNKAVISKSQNVTERKELTGSAPARSYEVPESL